MHLLEKEAIVLAFLNPMVLFGENNQTAGNAQPLQYAPIFQRLIKWNAKVVFTNRQQNRRAKVFRKPDWVLFAPHFALLPNRTTVVYFAMVDGVD